MTGHTPWEPTEEALGAALTAIDRARLPWLARWALRDGSKARSTLGREAARRVEGRVAARVREETTARINESWTKSLEARPVDTADEDEIRRLREALDYQASIIGRVEEVVAWGLPVGPEVLRVALDPAQSLQGAEEAAHAAAERVPEP